MYGNLIQLSGDFTERTTWRRVTPVSSGRADTIDENRLQDILFRHADALPLDEIDSAYETPVPVCRELGTRVGFVDALYLTPTGRIILAEFKLWRNSSARREVIGQILDYARVLASWSYDDLEREVRKRVKRSPFDIVSEAHGDVQEHIFIDAVARRLKRGEFLLLIIGDGIREGVEDIVSYVGAFLNRSQSSIGTYLTWRAGFPEEERVFEEIMGALDSDEELAGALDGWERWSNPSGRPRLGFSRAAEFVDGTAIRDFDEAVEWMREHFNRLVTALHPECRRRLRAKG